MQNLSDYNTVTCVLFEIRFVDIFDISPPQLSARAFDVVSQASADSCRHAEFFEFVQKLFGCIDAGGNVIALFHLVESY